LFVRGKGDVEREIPIPAATLAALEAWLRAHPSAAAADCATTTCCSAVRVPRAREHQRARRALQQGLALDRLGLE